MWWASGKIKIKRASSAVRGGRGEAMELCPFRSGRCRGFPLGHRVLGVFAGFSGVLHALEVRDLLPAGKWKPCWRSSGVLIRSPPEGSPGRSWGSSVVLARLVWGLHSSLIQITHPFLTPFLTEMYLGVSIYTNL